MNIIRKNAVLTVVAGLLFLAGCGTGGVLGGGYPSSSTSPYTISGTVEQVNTSSQYIVLDNVSSNLNGGGRSVTVYYDNRTPVNYNGQTYSPADLERGDQVSAQVSQSSNGLYANSMNVTYNVSANGSQYPNGNNYPNTYPSYNTDVRGTVQSVDASRETITVSTGTYGQSQTIGYDSSTAVLWNGQTYRPTDLQRGDEIDATVRDLGRGQLIAQSITVTYNSASGTSSTNGTYGTQNGLLRGTVAYVDTQSRTIQLNGVNWSRSFSTAPSGAGSVVVQYDGGTQVVYQGQVYAPTNLERGDMVDVQVSGSASNLYAQRITVVQNVRG